MSRNNILNDSAYPEGSQFKRQITRRHRTGRAWRFIFYSATTIAIVVLAILLFNVINQSFGLSAIQNEISPAELVQEYQAGRILGAGSDISGEDGQALADGTVGAPSTELKDLPYEALVAILSDNISTGLGRRLERDQLFFEDRTVFEDPALFNELCAGAEPPPACTLPARDAQNVYQLVLERVVVPEVVESWYLIDSILNRADIVLEAQEKYPGSVVEFRSWMTPDFLISAQSSQPELAGVRTAILGSVWVIVITIAFAFPVGVGAAIYLEEYADGGKWYNKIIQTNINNLAGVPSIIYGMLGLAVFVRAMEPITSGAIFGVVDDATTANGRTILSAGLTLGLLILPIIIISGQEAIRAVPNSLRRASLGLGATRWQTIWHHVLPNALPGILTGTIIAVSRAIGETAPLVVIGASTFITVDPTSPFSKFTVLPIQIYQWTSRPQGAFHNIAGAAIFALLILLLFLNASAVYIRNRTSKRMAQ